MKKVKLPRDFGAVAAKFRNCAGAMRGDKKIQNRRARKLVKMTLRKEPTWQE